jgi:redox-sensitive bicupin YhaK (pirin superfamily)
MKKKIRFSVQHLGTSNGDERSHRVLPNKFVQSIGHFVFLQHIYSCEPSFNELYEKPAGTQPYPHCGIATLTYILVGEVEHVDSIGNHVKLKSGGIHWTNAGKGIIHDEVLSAEFRLTNPVVSVLRFWINLSSKYKRDKPVYLSFQSNEVTKLELSDEIGWIKILLGEYKDAIAKIPRNANEFLYHINLQAGKQFSISSDKAIDYAVFLPSNTAVINEMEFHAGNLIAFTSYGELIELYNNNETVIDIILFGGEPYNEPIVAEGAFVMNTAHEVTQAYNDFYDGKFGQIRDFKNINSQTSK